jgi:hypothetical protein
MSDARTPTRPVTAAQVMGVVTFTLALFFLVAFITKTAEAYRLRNWQAELRAEIAAMERQKQDLQAEIERRQSLAWVDGVLGEAGYLPEGVVAVIPVPASGGTAAAGATPAPTAAAGQAEPAEQAGGAFDNPNWRGWGRLIWGFDGE